jgi:ribonuclease-3
MLAEISWVTLISKACWMKSKLEDALGYVFRDDSLLTEALTHSTYANEHRGLVRRDNQRLEFLGDTILNAVVTQKVFREFPDEDEGRLTKVRAEIVNEATLVRIARHLELGDALLLGKGEDADGGRQKPSLLADACEALIGALFLDSSFETACRVLEGLLDEVLGALTGLGYSDYKSTLIELCQSRFRAQPEIVVAQECGPDHDKIFSVIVRINGQIMGRGEGRSKKQASQQACREALQSLDFPLS